MKNKFTMLQISSKNKYIYKKKRNNTNINNIKVIQFLHFNNIKTKKKSTYGMIKDFIKYPVHSATLL